MHILYYLFAITNLLIMDSLAKTFLFQVNEAEKSSKLSAKLKRIAANYSHKISKDISSHLFHISLLQDLRITRINEVSIALHAKIKLESSVESKVNLNNTIFHYRDILCNKQDFMCAVVHSHQVNTNKAVNLRLIKNNFTNCNNFTSVVKKIL